MPETQTVYAKVLHEKDLGIFEQIPWHPWINVKPQDREMLPRLILGKWIRERGGVAVDERFSVTVYTYDEETSTYKNGLPRKCNAITFAVNYHDREAA